MLRLIFLSLFVTLIVAEVRQATVKIQGDVNGTVKFIQDGKEVKIEGEIKGLTPGEHGFHIHALGDISNGCASTGPHFNPYNKHHAAPTAQDRHVGDLGNIVADKDGIARISLTDSVISLSGETCIIGRAVVVHAGADDLGLGRNEESLKTGNAGGRVGCGIIGILEETQNSDGGGGGDRNIAKVSAASLSASVILGVALAIFAIFAH